MQVENDNRKNVKIRYESNVWTIDPQDLGVTEVDTYIEFQLDVVGYRFAKTAEAPPLTLVSPVKGPFIGPWRRDDNTVSLVDKKTDLGMTEYTLNLVQIDTDEPVVVPPSPQKRPTIVNS
jgi:hypothetical protein